MMIMLCIWTQIVSMFVVQFQAEHAEMVDRIIINRPTYRYKRDLKPALNLFQNFYSSDHNRPKYNTWADLPKNELF